MIEQIDFRNLTPAIVNISDTQLQQNQYNKMSFACSYFFHFVQIKTKHSEQNKKNSGKSVEQL